MLIDINNKKGKIRKKFLSIRAFKALTRKFAICQNQKTYIQVNIY